MVILTASMNPHANPEILDHIQVINALTDPKLDEQLGFPLLDVNPDFGDETNVAVLQEELDTHSPLIDKELVPVIQTAREQYTETISSAEALSAALTRWTSVYNEHIGRDEQTDTLLEAIAAEGFERFFTTTIDELPLSAGDKIMIAYVSAVLDHPGEKMAEPTNHGLFEAAANYIGRQEDRQPQNVATSKEDFADENSFGEHVVDLVTAKLADDALSNIFDLAYDPQALAARKAELTASLGIDIQKYLETIQLDWEILPPGTGEEIHTLESEAHARGWTFDRDRYLFLKRIQYATGGIMYKSSTFRKSRGYYLAVWAQDESGQYTVVTDNPINSDLHDHAVYVACESKIATSPRTKSPFTWGQVLSEDKATARALGAIKRKHTPNYKENVIDTLPQDLRSKVRSVK